MSSLLRPSSSSKVPLSLRTKAAKDLERSSTVIFQKWFDVGLMADRPPVLTLRERLRPYTLSYVQLDPPHPVDEGLVAVLPPSGSSPRRWRGKDPGGPLCRLPDNFSCVQGLLLLMSSSAVVPSAIRPFVLLSTSGSIDLCRVRSRSTFLGLPQSSPRAGEGS